MGFSRQASWSELPCPLPGDLPDSGTEPLSLMPPGLGRVFTASVTWEDPFLLYVSANELADSLPSTVLFICIF